MPILADEPAGTEWQGRRRMIVDHLAEVLGKSRGVPHAYLCGPPGMIDSCISTLEGSGVSAADIHFDKFLDQSHLAPAKKMA
ncbi:MAG: hypothetical protein WBN31_07715 [Gammaproteobacteria bacterium]